MNLKRCSNGHFYDEDRFEQCPHCGAGLRDGNPTMAMNRNDNLTVAMAKADDPGAQPPARQQAGEDSATVGYFKKAIGTEPVVGWLVCVEGNHIGEDFRLKSGRNFIGRSSGMDVPITGDNTVSRDRHAVVVYEPKNHLFLVQPGEARELCYLNDSVVLSAEPLSPNDVIAVGATKLMFFPCCTERFNWELLKQTREKE